jgi:hypothetical protein
MRVDEAVSGRPLGLLVELPLHPVCAPRGNGLYSADFPGAARQEVKARMGIPMVFLSGAFGDRFPATGHTGSWDAMERIGRTVGGAAVALCAKIATAEVKSPRIIVASKKVKVVDRHGLERQFLVQGVSFGDVVFAASPGALFSNTEAELARASGRHSLFCVSPANGWAGYLPDREAFASGGYERREACLLKQEEVEKIQKTLIEMVKQAND